MAMGDALAVEVDKVLKERNITVDVVIPVRGFLIRLADAFVDSEIFCRSLIHLASRL